MRKFIVLFGLLVCSLAQAQTTFGPQNIISAGLIIGPAQVCAGDLDGDGDMDVISQSNYVPNIVWLENTDGAGNFGLPQIITLPGLVNSLRLTDLDSDHDLDLLITDGHRVAWYENLDGTGNFGAKRIIATGLESGMDAFAEDLDGDGDKDVISASRDNGQVAWYKNLDGMGNFGPEMIISTSTTGVILVFSADMDGDNYKDVISCAYWGDFIVWHKNLDGAGTFSSEQMITDMVDGPMYVCAEDMDGDGDMDILSASQNDRKHAWYENRDGHGNFGDQQILADSVIGANYILAPDLDNDGDMDVLAASMNNDEIVWYENMDGIGNFSNKQVIAGNTDFPSSVAAADIDGDGDIDVVASLYNDDIIAWYRNLSLLISTQPQCLVVCHNNSASFSAVAEEATGYQWQVNKGDGFSDLVNIEPYSGTDTNVLLISSVDTSMSGFQYRCLVFNQLNSLYTDTAMLTVLELPEPVIYGPAEVPEGSVKTYFVMQANGSGYVFDVTNGIILSSFPDSICVQWGPKGPGQIICSETDSMGCSGNPAILHVNVGALGTKGPNIPIIRLYPNPATSVIVISSDVRLEEVVVYDILGNRVLEKEINDTGIILDLSLTGKGFYFFAMKSGGITVNTRVIVQ